ncbi:MAG TPA: polysaccharide deacetylase family protein [Casimicrobiaceae bacterium]|nr:polysaccharide deacetylase family protein [Casimicrobiaceae bacterium]
MQPVPVLTYHATNVAGNDYARNDHVALAEDLRVIDDGGYRIVPLVDVVAAVLEGAPLPEKAVAITLDDGTDFDYEDLVFDEHGIQRSMMNVLRDFIAERGGNRQPTLSVTSFVIASPTARAELDRDCLLGRGRFGERWWQAAVASGLFGIANHGWDHNHPASSEAASRGTTGTFKTICDHDVAHLEVRRARDYIAGVAPNPAVDLFAYPYGESNAFLVDDYFPRGYAHTGTRAAFTTEPRHVTDDASPWLLPRYVCGAHWRSTGELVRLLRR